MSTHVEGQDPPGPGVPVRAWTVGSKVRAVIALAACGGGAFLVWRAWWDQGHPLQAAGRGLGSWTASQRIDAVREISSMGFGHPGNSIRLLLPVLDDKEAGVRSVAAEELGKLGANAIGVGVDVEDARLAASGLLARADDPAPSVRSAVATALGLVGTAAAAPRPPGRNARAAKKAAEPAVDVEAVAVALGRVLEDRDPGVRQAAITGLGAVVGSAPGGTRKTAAPKSSDAAAQKVADRPPPGLVAALDDATPAVRSAAAIAVAGYHHGLDPLVPTLIRRLDDDDLAVRASAAWALERIRPPAVTAAVVPALIARLNEKHPAPAATASAPAPPAGVANASGSDDPLVPIITLLGRVAPGAPVAASVLDILKDALKNPSAQARQAALEALLAFKSQATAFRPAIQELADKDPDLGVRRAAASALEKIKPAPK